MFGSTVSLVLIKLPGGRYGFRGAVPKELCNVREATKEDVGGQRAWRGEDGGLYCAHPMSFDSRDEAVAFARSKGFEV